MDSNRRPPGHEPGDTSGSKCGCSLFFPSCSFVFLARGTGIEPAWATWKASALPLGDTRVFAGLLARFGHYAAGSAGHLRHPAPGGQATPTGRRPLAGERGSHLYEGQEHHMIEAQWTAEGPDDQLVGAQVIASPLRPTDTVLVVSRRLGAGAGIQGGRAG